MDSRPGDRILRCCVGAQHLFIVAPYIKANALTRVLDAAGDIASLICVTKWNPHDLAMGVSDTECRTVVKERGGSFRLHPSLHAKYYRMNEVVLIGSANLTFSAMGWSTQPNLEILCRAGDDFDATAFQQQLLRDAREISDAEFSRWDLVAKTDIGYINPAAGGQPFLDNWRPSTRDPRHLELAYQGQDEEIASYDEQRAAHRDMQAMQIPSGLTPERTRTWASACLLSSPFTNTVIRLHGLETQDASRVLAETYELSIPDARRDMETVQNWLALLAPEISSSVRTVTDTAIGLPVSNNPVYEAMRDT